MQHHYIEYETRGGVDVIPIVNHFRKHVFLTVPFPSKKTSIWEISVHSGIGFQRRLNFHFFFFSVFKFPRPKKSSSLKVCQNCQKTALSTKISRISGIFWISGNFPNSLRGTLFTERIPEKNRRKPRNLSLGFPWVFLTDLDKKCRKSLKRRTKTHKDTDNFLVT
jgi:hypothetical protein